MQVRPSRTLIVALCGIICGLTALMGACRKPTAGPHIKQGNRYFAEAKFPEAIIEYRVALQADPRLADVRLKLAEAYLKVRDPKNALREYVRAADLSPGNIDAQLKAGDQLWRGGAFEDAKGRADKALAIDPKNVDAQVLRGNALAGLRDIEGAISEYQEAIALNPAQANAYAGLGRAQLAQGKRDEAEATLRRAVAAAPTSLTAHLALANFYWDSGRARESEDTLKQALQLEPNNETANRAMGFLYLTTGRAAEAEPFFTSIARTSGTTAASLSLADYYSVTKRFKDARRVLQDLAGRTDAEAAATVRLAAIDAAEGHRAQASERLHDLLLKYPKDPAALLINARLLAAAGKGTEALANTAAVVAVDPETPAAAEAHALAGQIHASLDHVEEAIQEYEQVLKMQVLPLEADLALAALHLTRGAAQKSITYGEQALAIARDNSSVRALLVRAYLAANMVDKAKAQLAELQKSHPAGSSAMVDLTALVQTAEKKYDVARASYARALQLDADDFEALSGSVQIDLATGHAKEAVDRVESRLARTKPTVRLLILAARANAAAGNGAKTEERLRQAIELDPMRLEAYSLLGQFYISQNRLNEAQTQFEDVVRRNPKSVGSKIMLAILLQERGRLAEAEEAYQQIVATNPRAAVAANNLAWLYVSGNRKLDEALQLAQSALQVLPEDPSVNDTLGWIYYRKALAPQAIRHLAASAEKVPKNPTFQYHLGMAYFQAGELEKARQALTRALALKADFEGAAEARKTLAELGRS